MSKAQSFFRAVNLRDDIDAPPRLAHYHPTSRSLPVVEAVLGRDPTIVIAAYGSGKSLAAGVGALATRNDARSRHALEKIEGRIKRVNRKLHQQVTARLGTRAKGLVIVLTGHTPDPVAEIARQAEAPASHKTLDKVLKWISSQGGRDHVAIIWDEFGRHLESLVAEGRARDLDTIQRLAEWAARTEAPTASLTLLLHQNLLAYAGALNPTSRNEWRKIEGRFRQIRFVEDSRELYKLVVAGIADRRSAPPRDADLKALGTVVESAVEAGWFDGASDPKEVADLIRAAWPVSAGALQALPRLVARIGQNERSLFSFLDGADLSQPIGFEELYIAFSEAMRSDVGVGGTHRRWIETESARSKTDNIVEREALAAACLLQLGADGERRRLGRKTLEAAIMSRGIAPARATEAVKSLISRKLLLHRRLNDDVSVWHGVDVDIAGRLAEERLQRADSFDLVAFLATHHPAPVVRATRHNARFGATRYLSGRFGTASALASGIAEPPAGSWGEVLYVLAETGADIEMAKEAASEAPKRVLLAIPNQPIPVTDVALELACLEHLRADEALLAEDPLVGAEIDELMAVARRQLATVLHRVASDRPVDVVWLHAGGELRVDPERPASIAASDLLDAWYPRTPRIANDQLMRQRVSKQMNTARVRLLTRLLESANKPWLGYGEKDTSVEASVYRTVLEKTGLHREKGGKWGFARPAELSDAGLKAVWAALENFFTAPSSEPKPLAGLVAELSGPPIGLPSGVLPVLVMAGYRAFARNVSLLTEGAYVADILGFDANRLFGEPERHAVAVHSSDDAILRYLFELADVFSHARVEEDQEVEALRFTHDAFEKWRSSLPEGARRSRRLSPTTKEFLGAVADSPDPADLFLCELPRLLGGAKTNLAQVVGAIERVRDEIDSIVEGYLEEAVRVLGDAFRLRGGDAVAGLQAWVACLDVDDLMRRDDLRLTDKAILRTARDTINGRYTPQSLARTISSVLLQRGIEQWQDSTAGQYAMALRECRTRIEDAALSGERPTARLAPIIRGRIDELNAMLERLPDETQTRALAAGGKR